MEKKVFAIYEVDVEGSTIKNVTTATGVKTKFTHKFYEEHQEDLDVYTNISEWVKPMSKPREPNGNRIVIDIEKNDVSGHELTQEKLEEAMHVLKEYIKENDPEYKKAKEDLEEVKKIKENFKVLGIELTQEILDKEKNALEILNRDNA